MNQGGLGLTRVKSYQFVHDPWIKRPEELVQAIDAVGDDLRHKRNLGTRLPLSALLHD